MNIYSADFSISLVSLSFNNYLTKVIQILYLSHFNLKSAALNFGDTFVTFQQNICGSLIWFRDTPLLYSSNILPLFEFPDMVWGHPFVIFIKHTTTI